MYKFYNPFKANRAEQMTDLWKYYVPVSGIDGNSKPLVVEGGRGSGKTMVFLCNSWREKVKKVLANREDISSLYIENSFVGIYYRVDTAFVTSMVRTQKGEDWTNLFETYLSVCLLREIFSFLKCLNDNMSLNQDMLKKIVEYTSLKFIESTSITDIEEIDDFFDQCLDAIEDKINSPDTTLKLRQVKVRRILSDISNKINELLGHRILFKFFIDEYESLFTYQQRIINTLIKHSVPPIVFNIGLRTNGMRTNRTISNTEIIEAPHDYRRHQISLDAREYSIMLKDICKKRFESAMAKGHLPENASTDIEFYLKKYDIEYEVASIVNSNVVPPYKQKLADLIKLKCKEEKISKELETELINKLVDTAGPLNSLIHYTLLMKNTHYTPTVIELLDAYNENNQKYQDWIHNRKLGAVFLLAKNYRKQKLYFGFDVFVFLSSGIVRYFLELCEQVFNDLQNENYNWNLPVSPEIQSIAAKKVSKYKIDDIQSYVPIGKELRIFVQSLGRIFNHFHVSDNANLGEPEPNHFSTNNLALSEDLQQQLRIAVMWSVLHEKEPTKRKASSKSVETIDYYLNRIYVPYFNISYRDKRKLQIECQELEDLLSGDVKLAFKAADVCKKKMSVINEPDNVQQIVFEEWE